MHLAAPIRRPRNAPAQLPRQPLNQIAIRAAPPRAQPLRKAGCSCGGGCPSCMAREIAGPDHPAEREADAVAARIMSMSGPDTAAPVQRMEEPTPMRQPEEEEETLQAQSEEEEETLQLQPEEEEETLQARAEPGGAVAPNANPMAGLGSGQPLSATTRAFFEPRFGRSFAHVRIHNGAAAGARARSVNARAFAYGRNIVFNQNRYSPGTQTGRHLLAHELTHVVQQGKSGPDIQRWAISGNTARADSSSDVLWNLARQAGSTGPDWPCIIPRSMRTSRMSSPPADFNAHYERYVQIGDRFDLSNLRQRTGPTLRIHLFTSARDIAIAGRFYPGMIASSGDVDIDISTAATDGTTPIRRMIIFGHASGTTMFGGTGTFDLAALTPEPHSFALANVNLLPRRCWFTRTARVRSVGCSSLDFAREFSGNYLRRGSAIRSTTSAVSPCCFGVWDRLAFTASSAAGSAILDGPFRTTRAFHRGRFWNRLRGRL